MAYSKLKGVSKTAKNSIVMFGLPALLYVLNGANEWMPQENYIKLAPVIGMCLYYLKNYLENK